MNTRLIPLLIFLCIVAVAALPLLRGEGAPPPPDVMTGQRVPATTPDGIPPGYLNQGAVLVNFFASWCAPCADEQPVLAAIAADTGVAIAGIVYKDTAVNVEAWLERYGNPFTVVGYDTGGSAAIDWGVYGVPETFLVEDGVIRWRHVGPLTPDIYAEQLRPLLQKETGL